MLTLPWNELLAKVKFVQSLALYTYSKPQGASVGHRYLVVLSSGEQAQQSP